MEKHSIVAPDTILNYLYKAERSVIENITLMLAQTLRYPFSHNETLGFIEKLQRDGLITPCAPDSRTMRSTWSAYILTDKGESVVEEGYGKMWDDAAFSLWLGSSAD